MYELKFFRECRIRCLSCGDVLSYRNRSKDDPGPGYPSWCSCKKTGLDPSASAYRILSAEEDWEDLSVPWEEFEERIPNKETLAALEEVERMRLNPSIGKGYTNLDELFADLKK